MKKVFNKKSLTIVTIICYVLAVLIFEIGYCNTNLFMNFVKNGSETINYNFSLCRILFYVIFLVLYLVFKNKFIDEAISVAENKYKRVFIYIATIAGIMALIVGIVCVLVIKSEIITRAMSIMLISVIMGYLFLIYVSNNHIKNIIVTAVTLGIVFSISVEFNHAIDEKRHFMTAFNLAFFNFDYEKNPITDKKIESIQHFTKFVNIDSLLAEKYVPEITNDVDMTDIPSIPTNYNFLVYVFPAIGIFIAKTFGGSIADLYILGRIFNLISYVILTCIAMKLIPYKKNIFYTLFVMPMMLLLATTYSVDGACIGLVAIFIAYCLKVYKESITISLKQFLILIALFVAMLLAKEMAYILVGFIFFMLPIWKTLKKNKKYLPIIAISTVVILIIGVIGVIYIKNTKLIADGRAAGNVSISGQIEYILNNPIHDIKLACTHTLTTLFNYNWLVDLHQHAFFGRTAPFVFLPLMLYILYVAVTEDDHNFKIKDRIIMIVAFLLVFAMTSAVLYLQFTYVGAESIAGYQTRYLVPILPLVLFTLSSSKFETRKRLNRTMNIAITSGVFIFISIIQTVL